MRGPHNIIRLIRTGATLERTGAMKVVLDAFDAGPLRMSRAIEAQVLLFMVPLYQRRVEHRENTASLSSYWSCFWEDDWSAPVSDADDLADFPQVMPKTTSCSEFPAER